MERSVNLDAVAYMLADYQMVPADNRDEIPGAKYAGRAWNLVKDGFENILDRPTFVKEFEHEPGNQIPEMAKQLKVLIYKEPGLEQELGDMLEQYDMERTDTNIAIQRGDISATGPHGKVKQSNVIDLDVTSVNEDYMSEA